MKSQRKVWIGVGAFVVVGTGAVGAGAVGAGVVGAGAIGATDAPYSAARDASALLPTVAAKLTAETVIPRIPARSFVLAQHGDHGPEAGKDPAKEPKDGGEGGESRGIDDLPPDLAFAVRLALLRGHLLVGDQLVKQGQWNAALPHFLHPSEEIYGDIKDALAEHDVMPFEAELKSLVDLVKKRRGGSDYARALKSIGETTASADAALQGKIADGWASFVIEAAVEAIKTAAGEYENAIVGRRIAKPVEYQDARGFIFEAERMIESVAAGLEKKDAAALKEVRTRLAELKKVFPAAVPPRTPIKDHGAMLALVSRIELAASRLM